MQLVTEPGAVAEQVEHWACVRAILGLNPTRVKPLTYKIDFQPGAWHY